MLTDIELADASQHVSNDDLQWLLGACPRLTTVTLHFGGWPAEELLTNEPIRCLEGRAPARFRFLGLAAPAVMPSGCRAEGDPDLAAADEDALDTFLPPPLFMPALAAIRQWVAPAAPPRSLARLARAAALARGTAATVEIGVQCSGTGTIRRLYELRPRPYTFMALRPSRLRCECGRFVAGGCAPPYSKTMVRHIVIGRWRSVHQDVSKG